MTITCPTADGLHRVAVAVLTTAWEDAGYRGGDQVRSRDRDEAVRFLTDDRGPHAESREDWCFVANVCPARLRTRALAMLASPEPAAFARAA